MDRNRQLGELWIEALAAERGVADNTFEAYGDHLDCYFRFLDVRGLTVDHVNVQVIADYLQHLHMAGYADKTIEGRRAVIRGLHRFLISEGIKSDDPTSQLPPMRRRQKLMADADQLNQLGLSEIFGALASPLVRDLVEFLALSPRDKFDLGRRFDLQPGAIVETVALLDRVGICRIEGDLYHLNEDALSAIRVWLDRLPSTRVPPNESIFP